MKLKDLGAFLFLGAAWGSSFMWIKIAVREVGPITLVAIRLLLGVLGLVVILLIQKPAFPRERKLWKYLAFIGITNTAIPFVLTTWGVKFVDSALAAILNSTVPIFTILIAHIALREERITLTRLLALLVGFIGIIILLLRDLSNFDTSGLLGPGLILTASLLYAFSAVFIRKNIRGVPPVIHSLIPMLTADVVLFTLVPVFESPIELPQLPITWVSIVWLGIIGSCLAFLAYFYLLHSIGPIRTSLVAYLFPLVGVILGVVFLNESLDWNLIAGGILVISSITLVNRPGKQVVE